ncbi:hypothetical protein, partial [Capnocytophaga sp. oral taxon 326]|uniref:hypothetical protein n=1 Tax=Capnocytophaga sp. oral taxon 326 TaxID=712212 RepID=UPI0002A40957
HFAKRFHLFQNNSQLEVLSITPPVFNLLRINKNIEAKSKLLLNPLFPTLKKEIIHLFICIFAQSS